MTRRDFMFKWSLYVAMLLPIWFLEVYVLARIPLLGVTPMLLPVAAVTVSVLEGSAGGGAFGLAVGALCDVMYGADGAMTLGITLLCVAAGLVAQYVLQQGMLGGFICSLGALVAIDGFRIATRLMAGRAALEPMLQVALPEIFWSLVFFPLVYVLFRWVHNHTQFATLF